MAFIVRRERGATVDHHYLHRDHLGSITAVTNETNGQIVERYSYDAWGKRRTATNWQAADVVTSLNYRGYTGHEHLDDVGIIHMNGRIYLPELGKMMSPDPITQSPENGQNYSRYSYVFNNPLKFTDPSGYKSDIDSEHVKPVSAPAYEGPKPLEHVRVVGSRGERMALLFHNEMMNGQWFNGRGGSSGGESAEREPGDRGAGDGGSDSGEGQDQEVEDYECSEKYGMPCIRAQLPSENSRPSLWDRINPFSLYNLQLEYEDLQQYCEPNCGGGVSEEMADMMAQLAGILAGVGVGRLPSSAGRLTAPKPNVNNVDTRTMCLAASLCTVTGTSVGDVDWKPTARYLNELRRIERLGGRSTLQNVGEL